MKTNFTERIKVALKNFEDEAASEESSDDSGLGSAIVDYIKNALTSKEEFSFSPDSPLMVTKYDANKALKYYEKNPDKVPKGNFKIISFTHLNLYSSGEYSYLDAVKELANLPSDAVLMFCSHKKE